VFAEKILPFVRRGGNVMIAVPGLREEPQGEMRKLFETWAEGDDALCFHTIEWWENLLKEDCGDRCDITVAEGDCFDEAWQDWYQTGHEFAARDREYLSRGLDRILNFVMIYIRKKQM
jgi:hypothetical protein